MDNQNPDIKKSTEAAPTLSSDQSQTIQQIDNSNSTNHVLTPVQKPGSYARDLLFVVIISILYFGSAGLILLLASQPNDSGAGWLLLAYIPLFPVWLFFVIGKFATTFASRAKTRSVIIAGFLLAFSSVLMTILNVHNELAGREIFYQSMFAGVVGLLVIIPASKIFKQHKLTALLMLLIATTFIWLGAIGFTVESNRTAKRENNIIANEQATQKNNEIEQYNYYVKALASLPFTVYVPPVGSNSVIDVDPQSPYLWPSTGGVPANAHVDIFVDGQNPSNSNVITLYMIASDSTNKITTSTKYCNVDQNTNANAPVSQACTYAYTTPGGSYVAIANNGNYNSYYITKGNTFIYFQDPDSVFQSSNNNLKTFIDGLVPATASRFQ